MDVDVGCEMGVMGRGSRAWWFLCSDAFCRLPVRAAGTKVDPRRCNSAVFVYPLTDSAGSEPIYSWQGRLTLNLQLGFFNLEPCCLKGPPPTPLLSPKLTFVSCVHQNFVVSLSYQLPVFTQTQLNSTRSQTLPGLSSITHVHSPTSF